MSNIDTEHEGQGDKGVSHDALRVGKGLRIALGHQARVGKDTFADILVAKYGGCKLSIASGVYDIVSHCQQYLGFEVKKDAALLQFIGVGLRNHYGGDIWVDRVVNEIRQIDRDVPETHIIVCDMRFPNEMEKLKGEGFTTIKITRSRRPIDRDPTHISETALAGSVFDHAIVNDGTLEEYTATIEHILSAMCTQGGKWDGRVFYN
jgi:hypothetical protein